MFNSKKTKLDKFKSTTSDNAFIRGGLKADTTTSENGAMKYVTSGSSLADQFSSTASYRNPRSYQAVSQDMAALWGESPLMAIRFLIYIRLITRVVNLFSGVSTKATQIGQGLRHEGIMRSLWLAINHEDSFYKNIELIISAGSWKDLIEMMTLDIEYHDWSDRQLNHEKLVQILLAGLENPNTSELIKKYLPQIKSNKQCKTIRAQARNYVGKYICSQLFGSKMDDYKSYKKYRKLKSSGTAHQWQQLISQNKLAYIDFNSIHGRALMKLVSSKFLTNNKLTDKYEAWIDSKPVAKFTGYVYELFKSIKPTRASHKTVNKQFQGLLMSAKNSNLLVLLDESGSMSQRVAGTNVTALEIAKSLTVFFANTLKGAFKNYYYRFAKTGNVRRLNGSTPVEQYQGLTSMAAGNTNFQAVADFFIDMKQKGVSEDEFPDGIVCLSDLEFDVANTHGRSSYGNFKVFNTQTNYQMFMDKMRAAGFSTKYLNNFTIILWDIVSRGENKFEEFSDCRGLIQMSGFDGNNIQFLLGGEKPKTTDDTIEIALSQELMEMVEV